jgi:hypothetical protein
MGVPFCCFSGKEKTIPSIPALRVRNASAPSLLATTDLLNVPGSPNASVKFDAFTETIT